MKITMRSRWHLPIAAAVLLLLAAMPSPAVAKAYIVINPDAASVKKYPLAIPDFINLGDPAFREEGRRLAQVMRDDLSFSGLFDLLDPGIYLEDPRRRALHLKDIDFRDWKSISAEFLIKGAYLVKGDRITVDVYLYDVFKQVMVKGSRIQDDHRIHRRIMHTFSDLFFKELFGEEGGFTSRIYFTSTRKSTRKHMVKNIFSMDYDGHNVQQVTFGASFDLFPAVSPDGNLLAFTSYRRGNPDLYIKDLNTNEIRVLSNTQGLNYGADWAPDGSRLAIVRSQGGRANIYEISAQGTVIRQLTNSPSIDISPSWSPDARSLALSSGRAGQPHLYTINLESGELHRLTFFGRYNSDPAWSPRGDRIAFACSKMHRPTYDQFDICLVGIDGSNLVTITSGPGSHESPTWSSNGRYLAFSSTRSGKSRIYIMNANGTNVRQITFGPGESSSPFWFK